MRKREKKNGISVHAIAGTQVVLLGLDATRKATAGLLGFNIYKRRGDAKKESPLVGAKVFRGIRAPRGKSRAALIQGFMWSDYEVDPNATYTYRVVPVYGKPELLEPRDGVSVTITTEDPEDKTHAVYFNRGVAGSQAYSKLFGERRKWYKTKDRISGRERWTEFVKPEDVPNHKAYAWLSRGLEEAMLRFIGQARDSSYSIRAGIYELTHAPVIQAFVDALERGVDVKIVHHSKTELSYRAKSNKNALTTVEYQDGQADPQTFKSKELLKERRPDGVARAANQAVARIGISDLAYRDAYDEMLISRTNTTISHNKFIVLLRDGEPEQVWTGSTNFTPGGIFGQSNVGHVVRDAEVAKSYLAYWEKLSTDPVKKSRASDPEDTGMRNWTVLHQPDLGKGDPAPNSITPVFSPRLTTAMLDWYADKLAAAKSSVHFTAAFTVADQIFEKVVSRKRVSGSDPYLRYLLLEGIGGLMKPKYPAMRKNPQNKIAWGETLKTRSAEDEHHQFIETLTGLNDHVNYLHTKYMLIDPLTDDPIVITGSANFSNASTDSNDENMLIIRGNTRVADIFLGEFMRLFNHFKSRNRSNRLTDEQAEESRYLVPDASWTQPYYADGTQEQQERLLFR
jgi:phosphatidylserine/phosphatidylglycerophosphate/cardiolipin synthase-like enzyme